MYYLGIDLGGTNIAVGIVDDNNQIIARATSKTKLDNAEQVADAMAETVYAALKNANITLDDVPWVGLGSPGTINKATGIIEYANPWRRCSRNVWKAKKSSWKTTPTLPLSVSIWPGRSRARTTLWPSPWVPA